MIKEGKAYVDDTDAEVNPSLTEVYYDGRDNDCDPSTVDNDQDGEPDCFDADCDGTPSCTDTDMDGLSDAAELNQGTDPNDPDTDGGGRSDGSGRP